MKKALILGASGGIGQAIVKNLLDNGYFVVGSYYSKLIENNSGNLIMLKLDINNKDEISSFFKTISGYGPFDLFINTISLKIAPKRFENIRDEDFSHEINSNVINYFSTIRAVFPMLNKKAVIIFILTEDLFGKPSSYLLPYICSKYALLGLMKALSVELKKKNIRVNAVSPGMLDTDFISILPNYAKENYAKKSPLNRLIKTEEVVNAINFLINNKSLNGRNLKVFGKDALKWK